MSSPARQREQAGRHASSPIGKKRPGSYHHNNERHYPRHRVSPPRAPPHTPPPPPFHSWHNYYDYYGYYGYNGYGNHGGGYYPINGNRGSNANRFSDNETRSRPIMDHMDHRAHHHDNHRGKSNRRHDYHSSEQQNRVAFVEETLLEDGQGSQLPRARDGGASSRNHNRGSHAITTNRESPLATLPGGMPRDKERRNSNDRTAVTSTKKRTSNEEPPLDRRRCNGTNRNAGDNETAGNEKSPAGTLKRLEGEYVAGEQSSYSVHFGPHTNVVQTNNPEKLKEHIATCLFSIKGLRCVGDGKKNLKDLTTKSSSVTTRLSITLSNEGDGAIEPEKYGNEITIERRLYKKKFCHCFISSRNGKLRLSSGGEIKYICDSFGIMDCASSCTMAQSNTLPAILAGQQNTLYSVFMDRNFDNHLKKAHAEAKKEGCELIGQKKCADHYNKKLAQCEVRRRQAEQKYTAAETYEKLKTNLSNLERQYFGAIVKERRCDISNIEERFKSLQKNVVGLRARVSAFHEKLLQVEGQEEASKTENLKAIQRRDAAREELDDQILKLNQLDEKLPKNISARNFKRYNDLQNSKIGLLENKGQQQETLFASEKDMESKQKAYKALRRERGKVQASHSGAKKWCEKAEEELNGLKKELKDLVKQKEDAYKELKARIPERLANDKTHIENFIQTSCEEGPGSYFNQKKETSAEMARQRKETDGDFNVEDKAGLKKALEDRTRELSVLQNINDIFDGRTKENKLAELTSEEHQRKKLWERVGSCYRSLCRANNIPKAFMSMKIDDNAKRVDLCAVYSERGRYRDPACLAFYYAVGYAYKIPFSILEGLPNQITDQIIDLCCSTGRSGRSRQMIFITSDDVGVLKARQHLNIARVSKVQYHSTATTEELDQKMDADI